MQTFCSNPMRTLTLASLCLAAACGASPPEDTITPRPSAPALDPNRPVILAFGDSLTSGHMVAADESYPSRLQAKLEAAGHDHQVVNDGESGLTTSGGLARLERALDLDPDIVVLELGGNDGLRGTPVEVIRRNLATLVTAFRKRGATVVVAGLTLPRNYGPDYIREFEDMYAGLAEEFGVPLIPFFLEGLVDLQSPADSIGVYMQADGTHPTAAGYTIVAETVFQAIEPYLDE